MSKNHSFNPEIAVIFGVTAAIIIQYIWFWTVQNIKNRKNYYDGSYWTYDSIRVMTEHFPYLTEKMIRGAIERLVTQGILKTGNYNKTKYDRTLWYALTEKGISIAQKCYMDLPLAANASTLNGAPVPNENTDAPTDVEADIDADVFVDADTNVAVVDAVAVAEAIVAHLNAKTGSSFKVTPKVQGLIGDHLANGYSPNDFVVMIDGMVSAWGQNDKMKTNLRPSTLFGDKFDEYLNIARNQTAELGDTGTFDTNDLFEAALRYSMGDEVADQFRRDKERK